MATKEYHFINAGIVDKIRTSINNFREGDVLPDQLLMKLKELLPVHRTDRETWKNRVEGLSEASQILLEYVLEKGKVVHGEHWDEETVLKQAKLRPLSYYHYVTGSREPATNVRGREDYFNDPTTALVKLEDDVIALAKLYKLL